MSPREGDFDLVTLRNGHRAVRHLPSGEVMHPSVGPWEEANSLYVEQLGLADKLQREGAPLVIHDVGLGAATNAIAALTRAQGLGDTQRRPLHVVSFERDLGPLKLALADPEGFPAQAGWAEAASTLIEHGAWSNGAVRWTLHLGEVLDELPRGAGPADLVFYDPFSPETNPSLWTRQALAQVLPVCRTDGEGCLLATYSAATRTRVSFLLAGFFIGRGRAVGTKKETTVAATRREALEHPLGEEFLGRWRRSSARAPHGEELTPELEAAIEKHLAGA